MHSFATHTIYATSVVFATFMRTWFAFQTRSECWGCHFLLLVFILCFHLSHHLTDSFMQARSRAHSMVQVCIRFRREASNLYQIVHVVNNCQTWFISVLCPLSLFHTPRSLHYYHYHALCFSALSPCYIFSITLPYSLLTPMPLFTLWWPYLGVCPCIAYPHIKVVPHSVNCDMHSCTLSHSSPLAFTN